MNCLNRLSIGARAEVRAQRCAGMTLRLASGETGVPKSVSEELELLEWVNLLDSSLAHLQAMLWSAAPHRGPWQQDNRAIIKRIE